MMIENCRRFMKIVQVGHAKVADVAVLGIPNDEFGEEAKAVVQPVNFQTTDSDSTAAGFADLRKGRYSVGSTNSVKSVPINMPVVMVRPIA